MSKPVLLDLAGRVNNYSLRPSECLVPLFEAIVNSIQSINSLGISNGLIEVRIIRDTQQLTLDPEEPIQYYPVIGFSITDNGIGFNTDNFDSFSRSDTTFKKIIRR